MLNIGMVVPGKDDATSFYRAWGPFSEMRKALKVDVNLIPIDAVTWSSTVNLDVMFIQRPFNKDHVGIVQMAKSVGLPVWADWDDALWALPKDNPVHDLYSGCEKHIREIASHADVVTTSTKALADALGGTVIKNELPGRFADKFTPPVLSGDKIRIVWRGSETHGGDWLSHLPGVIDACRGEAVQFVMVGKAPFFVIEALLSSGIKVGSVPSAYIEQYLQAMVRNDVIKGDVMFVPLRDNQFNRCKSNIAQIEGTGGGMLTVCPAWAEWDRPDNRLGYTESCAEALKAAFAIVRKGDHMTHVKGLQSKYRKRVGSEQRWAILEGLI